VNDRDDDVVRIVKKKEKNTIKKDTKNAKRWLVYFSSFYSVVVKLKKEI